MAWLEALALVGWLTLLIMLALVFGLGRWRDRVHLPKTVLFGLFHLPEGASEQVADQWEADRCEDRAVRRYVRRAPSDSRDELAA